MASVPGKMGASLLALSRALAPTLVAGAGLSIGGAAHSQTVCLPAVGINIQCNGGGAPVDPALPVLDPGPISGPVIVSLGDGFQAPNTVNLTTLGNAADVTINALGTAAIDTVNQPGLTVNSGGAINGRVTSIATQGDGAEGALLRAADGTVFSIGDLVSTTGDNAPGIDAQGNSVAITGNLIQTQGNNSNAVQLVSLNGPVDLDANALRTNGDLSTAALLRSAGAVNVNVGILQTQGSRALGLDIGTNPATCVLLGNGQCDVTAAADQITTNGFGGVGALVSAATGVTTVNVGALQTNGDEAAGLSLSANPTVCATLGAGACDQNFTVGNLTTQGARSPGALVRAAGNITGNVTVLRTNGADAIGLDLASAPDACVLLGKGQCGTSFNVGQLTTSGAGATGVLARVAGPTTGRVGILGTSGNNANGIDILADPTACTVLGSGACDVGITANQVTTRGDGAAAVLINAPGNIVANIGTITTAGNNAPGLGIVTNPIVCLALGPGSCTINATTGSVTTGGNNSPGVGVTGGDDPITIATGPVTTGGANSPGVSATGTGPITVTTGSVATGGANSPGVLVRGGDDPVRVDTTRGTVATSGANSNGIDVATTSGNQTILAGPVNVTGAGSSGIVATSPGCSAIAITATGPITATQGIGIRAASACSVAVTTLQGAPITGGVESIDVTSGTGATITIGDRVASGTGPAINVDGAAALVTVTPTGTIDGRVDLTGGNDRLVNNGTFNAVGDSAFGSGADSLANNGTLTVRRAMTVRGTVAFTGLETFANAGLVDLRNGVAGDALSLSGGFTGTGQSTLGLDIAVTPAGTTADRLVIGGAATGSTAIVVNQLATNPGLLLNNVVLVDAGPGSAPDAFRLAGVSAQGLVGYSLVYDPAGQDYALYGTPGAAVYELAKAGDGARQIFYRTDDAWSGHMQSLRDGGGYGDSDKRRGSALWGQMFGSVDQSRSRVQATAFGQTQSVILDNRQDFFGGQIGYDFGSAIGSQGAVFGVTAGYVSSKLDFRAGDQIGYDAANGGGYASFTAGAFFIDGLAKYEHYWLSPRVAAADIHARLDGNSYGGKVQAGFRLGGEGFFIQPLAAIDYVRTSIDTLAAGPSTLDFAKTTGLRGQAGVQFGSTRTSGTSHTSLYASAMAVHEFKGRTGLTFVNNGQSLIVPTDRIATYGHGVIGLNVVSNGRINGFIEASGDASKTYRGGGGRVGLNMQF